MLNAKTKKQHNLPIRVIQAILDDGGRINNDGMVHTHLKTYAGQAGPHFTYHFCVTWSELFHTWFSHDLKDEIEMAHRLKKIITGG